MTQHPKQRAYFLCLAHSITASNIHSPCRWTYQRSQNLQECCLPSTIWPKDTKTTSALELQVNASQGGHSTEAFHHACKMHHHFGAHTHPLCSSIISGNSWAF